jgi:hypothetical protein
VIFIEFILLALGRKKNEIAYEQVFEKFSLVYIQIERAERFAAPNVKKIWISLTFRRFRIRIIYFTQFLHAQQSFGKREKNKNL